MSEFRDRPFVAGSLVGLRAFAVDTLGRLVGPTYGQVFTPGENDAECRKERSDWFAPGGFMPGLCYRLDPATGDISLSREAVVKARPAHTLAGMQCDCGFYAYFDGGNDYAEAGRISAIIEGYGVCTVGGRGFRASKARLLALVIPEMSHGLLERALGNYTDTPQYAGVGRALDAHPLTASELPSPADPDFWTRDPR